MTGKEAAERMLHTFSVQCDIVYGKRYSYNPFKKLITVRAIDISMEVSIASCLHEAAHAIQHKRDKWKILLNSVLRTILPSFCKLETVEIEKEANMLAGQWLTENSHLFRKLDIDYMINKYYPNQLKLYA